MDSAGHFKSRWGSCQGWFKACLRRLRQNRLRSLAFPSSELITLRSGWISTFQQIRTPDFSWFDLFGVFYRCCLAITLGNVLFMQPSLRSDLQRCHRLWPGLPKFSVAMGFEFEFENDLGMAEVDRTASGDPATKQSTPMLARPEGEEIRPKWSHRNVFELGCACVGMIAA